MKVSTGNDFWNDKLVLVTGAAGFLGSHLCEKLVSEGARVRAFIRYNSSNSHGLLESIPKNIREQIEIMPGDILIESSLSSPMKDVDIVFHMAAIPSIPYSMQNPRHVYEVNIQGSVNVLFAALESGVKKVVLASSGGASEKRPLLSPYITSKAAMEKVGQGFHQGLGPSVSSIRLLNNFGPRQSARAIIPTIISQALVKNDVNLGALEPQMDFNYFGDTMNALLRVAEIKNEQGKFLTWGTGISTSIGDVAKMIFDIIGNKRLHIVTDEARVRASAGPMASLEDDIIETHKLLHYVPETKLEAGLKNTIEWISQHLDQYKPEIYNV